MYKCINIQSLVARDSNRRRLTIVYSTSTVALFILPCIMSDLCPPYAPFFGFAGVSAAVSLTAGLKCWQF